MFFISVKNSNVACVLPIQNMNLHTFISISWSSNSRKLPIYIRRRKLIVSVIVTLNFAEQLQQQEMQLLANNIVARR